MSGLACAVALIVAPQCTASEVSAPSVQVTELLPDGCVVEKHLAQADLGDGYADFQTGTRRTVGLFLPSLKLRGAVKCTAAMPGWEIGFAQFVLSRRESTEYSSGTTTAAVAGPLPDANDSATGDFKAISARKSVASGLTTSAEYGDQPRLLVTWDGKHEREGTTQIFQHISRFRASNYFVLFNESLRTIVILRKIVWESGMLASCNTLAQVCAFSVLTRPAVTVEPALRNDFPVAAFFGTPANKVQMKESWRPKP